MAGNLVRDAVLLAAGKGTRLGSLTDDVPKPMLPIAGKPLLEYTVAMLRTAGIGEFTFVTGYRAEVIESFFGDGRRFDIRTHYRRQEVQDGTARALLLARECVGDRPFLLAWGDILIEPGDYRRLLDRFSAGDAEAVLAVKEVDDPSSGGAVTFSRGGAIEAIVEKPAPGTLDTRWINAGIGVFRPGIFPHLERVEPSPRGEYEIPDALQAMIAGGLRILPVPLEGAWIDVGRPEDLDRARRWLERGL